MCPIYIAVRTQKIRQIYISKLPSDTLLKLLLYYSLFLIIIFQFLMLNKTDRITWSFFQFLLHLQFG